MSKIETGELLYEVTLNITGMTEYGVSFGALMAGEVPPPPEGARFDFAIEGAVNGPKLKGELTGVDYLRMRADGRIDLNVYLKISTDDGQNIAGHVRGVVTLRPESSISDLRENITLFSSFEDCKWVNPLEIWGIGTVDLATKIIKVSAYSA